MILKLKSNNVLIIVLIQFFLGVYACILNTEYIDSNDFIQVFIRTKCGMEFEFTPEEFNIGILLNLLNLLIGVALIPMIISKNYKSDSYYVTIRIGNYNSFYFRMVFKCIKLSFLSEILFDVGVFIVTKIKFNNLSFSVDKQIILLIVNYFVIILLFSLLGTIISVLFSEKIGVLLSISLIVLLAILVFYLPNSLKQFDVIAWLYVEVFVSDRKIFKLNIHNYYLIIMMAFFVENILGLHLLKRNTL